MKTNKRKGFTIVELLVVAPTIILAVGAFVVVIIVMVGEAVATRSLNVLTYQTQEALNRIDQDVRSSVGFLAQSSITFTSGNPQGYGDHGSTTAFENVGANGPMLILQIPATSDSPNTPGTGFVYLWEDPLDCSSSNIGNYPKMMINVVYFIKDDTLWRRTVMPQDYTSAGCATPWQQPSCMSGYSSSFCKTDDERLVYGVSTEDFFVQYFSSPDSQSPLTAAVTGNASQRQEALDDARSIEVSLTANQTAGGRDISYSGTLKATLTNLDFAIQIGTPPPVTPNEPDDCDTIGGTGSFIPVPGNSTFGTEGGFCVMKYEAKIQGNSNGNQAYNSAFVPESRASGTPWVNISQANAIAEATTACTGCHLITENQWLTIAHDIMSVPSNWINGTIGSAVGSGGGLYRGHSDNGPSGSLAASANDASGYEGTGQSSGEQRRTLTLSNGEIIWDFAGNVHEWINATMAAGTLPGLAGDSGFAIRQYNNASLIWNGFPEQSKPWYGTPAASSWSSSQNMGSIYTNYADNTLRAPVRGGSWGGTTHVGVLTINLDNAPSGTGTSIGFRVAR